ncbi:MAG TPA: hypothetical protein VLA72_13990 [Anaerolineales bacterium]|nr:hypothetical protein [Anaerolineales bacterium]
MTKAGRSLFIFGIYTIFNGIGLLLIPNVFLSLFGMPPANEIWVRVAGWLICVLGFYYTVSGRQNNTPFIRLTVYGRASVFVFYFAIVLLGLTKPIILVVGLIDLLSAIWTITALRSDGA